ncbi:hypothetical protein LSH36_28g09096 [Paralvinella palmiformis]|uniref:Endonuclease/exonuclease/phosphatase domain-containing protein n=1 Tax=Paralvinella palmiformis TaxID=53620 RepID=A0AAD9KB55_9ANNE|nr:hypothetical protein LSH36_28g09096 [Paralvinella palmiformis]
MFMSEFNTSMLDRLDYAGELVLVGDLNFHSDKPSDPESKKFLSFLESLNFIQNVLSATSRSGYVLDVVATRDNEHVLQDLTELESLALPSVHDVVILTDHYNQSLTRILDHHAPAREKTITIRPSKSWFSDDIHRTKCEERKLEGT